MMRLIAILLVLAFIGTVAAETYFKEEFDSTWENRWVVSDWKKSEGTSGPWKHTAGEFYGDAEKDAGIQTSVDARFYAVSAKLPKPFSNEGKDLVVQYSVKFPQNIDCGGGYIKLLPANTDQANFGGESKYYVMFGPDICGTTKRTHAILTYKDTNHLVKKQITAETDRLTHVYTLILHPDQTYEVRIDGVKKESGSLLDDWDFLPAKTVKDPSVSKPKDWVDDPMIDDPSDVKPAGYDDQPKQIPDSAATKPEDWDDDADGEWEAPLIDNPAYKGEWKPKRISNPDYKGPWTHPEIPNPEYVEDKKIYAFPDIGAVGFELWQVKSGSIFDNILITDSVSEAESFLAETWGARHEKEKAMMDEAEKARQAKEEADRAAAAEASKKESEAAAAGDDDEDDEEEGKKHDEL